MEAILVEICGIPDLYIVEHDKMKTSPPINQVHILEHEFLLSLFAK